MSDSRQPIARRQCSANSNSKSNSSKPSPASPDAYARLNTFTYDMGAWHSNDPTQAHTQNTHRHSQTSPSPVNNQLERSQSSLHAPREGVDGIAEVGEPQVSILVGGLGGEGLASQRGPVGGGDAVGGGALWEWKLWRGAGVVSCRMLGVVGIVSCRGDQGLVTEAWRVWVFIPSCRPGLALRPSLGFCLGRFTP